MPIELKICIVGGGPAGLMLGCLLQSKRIPFTLLVSDAHPLVRTQGGTLDIHEDSGQLPLKEAGLLDKFKDMCRVEGQAFRVCSKEGDVLVDFEAKGRPEIDRGDLRGLLLGELDMKNIKWGSKVLGVQEQEE